MKRKNLCKVRGERLKVKGIFLLSIFIFQFSICFADDSITVDQPKKEKKQIYYSTQVKLDILSPVLTPGLNNWQMQHYEIAANVQLVQRFYPTIELGYAGGKTHNDSVQYNGHGGFVRIGCDINPLKKHPESPHSMLVGVRLGSAVQTKGETDCWGEVVVGCQVEIAQVNKTAFYMGWMGRLKILFTREKEGQSSRPIYIPGFGIRDNVGWGANYYLGWRF